MLELFKHLTINLEQRQTNSNLKGSRPQKGETNQNGHVTAFLRTLYNAYSAYEEATLAVSYESEKTRHSTHVDNFVKY